MVEPLFSGPAPEADPPQRTIASVLGPADAYGDGEEVRCAFCGDGYTHVVGAGTLKGSSEGEDRVYPGTVVVGHTGSRRSAVVVLFECEFCPGGFAMVIQQHKGRNYTSVVTWPDKASPPEDLWRLPTPVAHVFGHEPTACVDAGDLPAEFLPSAFNPKE